MNDRQTPMPLTGDHKAIEINNLFNKLISFNYETTKFSESATER